MSISAIPLPTTRPATLDDLAKVDGKAELIDGRIVRQMPTGRSWRELRLSGTSTRSLGPCGNIEQIRPSNHLRLPRARKPMPNRRCQAGVSLSTVYSHESVPAIPRSDYQLWVNVS
jgi:hypothetical protein